MMYSELVNELRYCASTETSCSECRRFGSVFCEVGLHKEAADAIEKLCGLCASQSKDCSEAVAKYLELWAKQPRWIPVTERLPQDAGIYIICDHYGNVMSRHFCKSHGKFAGYWHFNGSEKYGNPTHWMPLPEPPKEETE